MPCSIFISLSTNKMGQTESRRAIAQLITLAPMEKGSDHSVAALSKQWTAHLIRCLYLFFVRICKLHGGVLKVRLDLNQGQTFTAYL